MVTKEGRMTAPWLSFWRDLFVRIGGTEALTPQELEALPALELAALTTRVTSAENAISALQTLTTSQGTTISTHTTQINDLGQGPVL